MPAPTQFEQELLELINRARLDPQGEYAFMIVDQASQTGTQDNITSALRFFNVNLGNFETQLAGLSQVAPLAWDDRLAQAAGKHSQRMIAEDTQSHQLPGEADLGARISAEGYNWNAVGENVYAYTQDPVHGHAGFYVDWGFDTEDFTASGGLRSNWQALGDGIQDPAGHRITILSENYVEIGINAVEETNPATEVGPWVVTQNFGSQFNNDVRIVGVTFADSNADGFYTAGEGVSGVTWSTSAGGVTGWDSGGYQVTPATETGPVQVSATLPGFAAPAVATLVLAEENAKLDLVQEVPGWGWRSSASLTLEQTVSRAALLGAQDLNLTATDGLDAHMTGNAGANALSGAAGDDTGFGGDGADTLTGGDGADSLIGEGGDDAIFGGNGADILDGGAGNDTMQGGIGDDTIRGGDGRDRVFLGFGNDVFVDNGQGGPDGSDTVFAWAGDDTIQGGNGDDFFFGHSGADVIHGRLGNDRLFGGTGYDTIYAGDGNDLVFGGRGRDLIFLGDGRDDFRDTAQGGIHGRDTVWAGDGNDTLRGSLGDDAYYGEGGDDLIYAGQGNDVAFGGTGADRLYGDGGDDTLGGGDGRDLGFLGEGSDRWFDTDDAAGHDFVFGAAGDDTIEMRGGNDTAEGAAGADTFVLGAPGGAHRISDFEVGLDAIHLDAALWSGTFDAARFDELADTSSGSLVLSLTTGSLTLTGITRTDGVFDDLLLI